MKRAVDGSPTVGNRSKELGVREPPDVYADVDVDDKNQVILNGRGMSVAENGDTYYRISFRSGCNRMGFVRMQAAQTLWRASQWDREHL